MFDAWRRGLAFESRCRAFSRRSIPRCNEPKERRTAILSSTFCAKDFPRAPGFRASFRSGDAAKAAPPRRLRVAIHLHAFYPDQLAGIVERLNLNASTPDLFISVVTPDAAAQAREALSGYRGRIVDVQITPNLGRDIGPLLTQFGRALCAGYDIIGHLHTKKSVHVTDRPFAEAWNTFLLENLVGGKRGGAMLDAILSTMAPDPAIGIVFPDDPHVIGWTKNRKYAEDARGPHEVRRVAGAIQFSGRHHVLDAVRGIGEIRRVGACVARLRSPNLCLSTARLSMRSSGCSALCRRHGHDLRRHERARPDALMRAADGPKSMALAVSWTPRRFEPEPPARCSPISAGGSIDR